MVFGLHLTVSQFHVNINPKGRIHPSVQNVHCGVGGCIFSPPPKKKMSKKNIIQICLVKSISNISYFTSRFCFFPFWFSDDKRIKQLFLDQVLYC